jgi:superfamily II DNA or RNA helicase
MQISQSDIVRVRQARWRVLHVQSYERCQLLTLAGAGPSNTGNERGILAPFDDVEHVDRRTRPARVSRRLWRRACRALLAADTPPGSLVSIRLARIDVLPHQLEPALAIVRGLGSRVLLADDVGLGKTIQAGLIVAELRALGAAERVLIVTPAGLRDQWADELSGRLGLAAAVLDVRALQRAAQELPLGVSPWQAAPIAVASVDYLKRPEVLAAAAASRWDVLIVDEAHGVAGDNDRHAAVAALAARSGYVVLVTATPHSGDRRSFVSLCRTGQVAGDRLLVFRRSRDQVSAGTTRRIHRLYVRTSADEAQTHALLRRFSLAVRNDQGGRSSADPHPRRGASSQAGRPDPPGWRLALAVLQKRALSSALSLKRSVDRRLAVLGGGRAPLDVQLDLPLEGPPGELSPGDEVPEWSPLLHLRDAVRERHLLGALSAAAARASRHETKIAALGRLLRRVREPVIVFTEYRDTLLHLHASLEMTAVLLHGGLTREERQAALSAFTHGGAHLLLATDAAGEGLNLQRRCRIVINLELPWNPMRLEQRIGRVDRIGQRRTVHVFHLIARDSGELEVLSRLQSRVAKAHADVGGADPLGFGDDRLEGAPAGSSLQPTAHQPSEPLETLPADVAPWTPPLAEHAVAEARRAWSARLLSKARDELALARCDLGPCLAAARLRTTRARLGRRTLMIWQATAEDGCSRRIGSMVVGITADAWNADGLHAVRNYVEHVVRPWREAVTDLHRAFTDGRLARERGIGAERLHEGPASADLLQPGLFDRRAERARLALRTASRLAAEDRSQRLRSIECARCVLFPPPQLVLVLTP